MPAQLAGLGANSESDGLAGPHPGSESESETTNRPETPRDLVTGASPWPGTQRSRQAVPGKASTQPGSCHGPGSPSHPIDAPATAALPDANLRYYKLSTGANGQKEDSASPFLSAQFSS